MKKKLLAVLLSALMLCAMLPLGAVGVSAATTGTYNGMTYAIMDDEVTITGYTDELPSDVAIPSTIEGYPVTRIGKSAFSACEILYSLWIRDNVLTIEESAFAYCENLYDVRIFSSVTTIEDWAFYSCDTLQQIMLPDSVTYIGRQAFCACMDLIDISVNSTNYRSVNGILFSKDLTTLICYPAGKQDKTYTIPNTVTSIEWYAFYGNANLTSVTIPNGITAINDSTFYYCPNLETVTIPSGVTTIGMQAFMHCWNLTSVIIPSTLTTIDRTAFNNCSSLTAVYYEGNEADREAMDISGPVLDVTWYYNCINPKDNYSSYVTHSVMDTANGNGLAFRFELLADGVGVKNRCEADLTNATVNYLGTDCKLVKMGAVLTNAAESAADLTLAKVNGGTVLDVPAVYLQELNEDSCAFAVRIINIPDTQLERTIYARPYYVVEVDGEEIVVYSDVDDASCAEYI